MYDSYEEYFDRHFDFFRNHDDYQAYMKGEDSAEGSLPVDCEPTAGESFLTDFENDDSFNFDNFDNEGDS